MAAEEAAPGIAGQIPGAGKLAAPLGAAPPVVLTNAQTYQYPVQKFIPQSYGHYIGAPAGGAGTVSQYPVVFNSPQYQQTQQGFPGISVTNQQCIPGVYVSNQQVGMSGVSVFNQFPQVCGHRATPVHCQGGYQLPQERVFGATPSGRSQNLGRPPVGPDQFQADRVGLEAAQAVGPPPITFGESEGLGQSGNLRVCGHEQFVPFEEEAMDVDVGQERASIVTRMCGQAVLAPSPAATGMQELEPDLAQLSKNPFFPLLGTTPRQAVSPAPPRPQPREGTSGGQSQPIVPVGADEGDSGWTCVCSRRARRRRQQFGSPQLWQQTAQGAVSPGHQAPVVVSAAAGQVQAGLAQETTEPLIVVPVRVGKCKVAFDALYDTGCSANFLKLDVAKRAGLLQGAERVYLQVQDVSRLSGAEESFSVVLPLQVGQCTFQVHFYVVQRLFVDCIVGLPTAKQLRAELDWSAKRFCFRHEGRGHSVPYALLQQVGEGHRVVAASQVANPFVSIVEPEELLQLVHDGHELYSFMLTPELSVDRSTCAVAASADVAGGQCWEPPPEDEEGDRGDWGDKQIRVFRDFDIHTQDPQFRQRIKDILEDKRHLFVDRLPRGARSVAPGEEFKIELKPGAEPQASSPYPLSPVEMAELRKVLQDLEDRGQIRFVSGSRWASPCFFVKTGKRLRCVFDMRKVNAVTRSLAISMPTMSSVIDSLKGFKYFHQSDMKGFYNQLSLAEESQEISTVTTPYGLVRPSIVLFGLRCAPNYAQGVAAKIFKPLVMANEAHVYIDDWVCKAKTQDQSCSQLKTALDQIEENQVYINFNKSSFARSYIEFLGYRVDGESAQLLPSTVAAVQEWPVPTSTRETRQFLGFVNVQRRYIEHYSEMARPLEQLCGKGKFVWGEQQQRAFEQLKQAVVAAPVLALPDPDLPYRLVTDASQTHSGACLMQPDPKRGSWKVVAYVSSFVFLTLCDTTLCPIYFVLFSFFLFASYSSTCSNIRAHSTFHFLFHLPLLFLCFLLHKHVSSFTYVYFSHSLLSV
jgi:hypothetical protein